MVSVIQQLSGWFSAPLQAADSAACQGLIAEWQGVSAGPYRPGECTDQIVSNLINKLPQKQIDNALLRTARHIRTLPAPSEFMMIEEEFLNYALQTQSLINALKPIALETPKLLPLLASYENSLAANYRIYVDPKRNRGNTRDVILQGVDALKKQPDSFLNLIALTPNHMFNMRLMRNDRPLDKNAIFWRYPLVDMLNGQINNFLIYDYINAGVECMKGVDIAVLNRGAKGMQTDANKAIYSFDGRSVVELTAQSQLPDQTMGNCVTVNTTFGLVDALTDNGFDLIQGAFVPVDDSSAKQKLLERNNEALAAHFMKLVQGVNYISEPVQQEITRTEAAYQSTRKILEGAQFPYEKYLEKYTCAAFPLLLEDCQFSKWSSEAQALVRFVADLHQHLKARTLEVDDPRIDQLIQSLPAKHFALEQLALLVANYLTHHVDKLSFKDAAGNRNLEVYERAIVLQKKAYELNPDKGNIVNRLGRLYEQLGDLKSAQGYLARANRVDPNNTYFHADFCRVERKLLEAENACVLRV